MVFGESEKRGLEMFLFALRVIYCEGRSLSFIQKKASSHNPKPKEQAQPPMAAASQSL